MSHIANIRPWSSIAYRLWSAEELLETYRGYSQADAYVAYDSFFTDRDRGLVEVGCMAHVRRHIHQARETDPATIGTVLAYGLHCPTVCGGGAGTAKRHSG
jgi:hypothetical protein